MVMGKNKSVSGFLEKLGKLNDDKLKVFLPSIKKSIDTTPLTLKQQKDLISSALDGVKGALYFNKTLNNIIINNTGNHDLKIYDKFPFIMHLRKHSLGDMVKVDKELVSLSKAIKNLKTIPFKIKEDHQVELKNLKVFLKIPTLAEENVILSKGEQDVDVKEDSSREGLGMLYMLEIIKYIDKLVIDEEEIEFTKIKINDRIKLIEELPLTMYKGISEYIEDINIYLNDILTVDDSIIPIDVRFFDTTDID